MLMGPGGLKRNVAPVRKIKKDWVPVVTAIVAPVSVKMQTPYPKKKVDHRVYTLF